MSDATNEARIDEVLAFWFGADPRQWFMRDDAFDALIRERFGGLHDEVAAGAHDDWRATPRGALALVIVLDQFSRNLYRDDPRTFAQDPEALAIALELLDTGRARELNSTERAFLVMPFEHAEDMALQRRGIAEADALVAACGSGGLLGAVAEYARKHAAVIERFGRFPHRNKVLGRTSSPEELAFLQQPGSRF